MIHPNVVVVFYVMLISCWVVAASLMAEKTNLGMAVFIADITSRPLCVVSCRRELLPSFLRAGLSASAAINLSSPVLRCCLEHSSILCDQLKDPPRT